MHSIVFSAAFLLAPFLQGIEKQKFVSCGCHWQRLLAIKNLPNFAVYCLFICSLPASVSSVSPLLLLLLLLLLLAIDLI